MALKNGRRGSAGIVDAKVVSQGRHEAQCSVCSHQQKDEIERAFVGWSSLAAIEKDFGVSRDSVYRHARAFRLLEERRRNVRAALERIIEHAGEVSVNAAAVVAAVTAYARINARGELVDRMETVDLNQLFYRMSTQELEAYARDGVLPDWFSSALGATGKDSHGESDAI